MVYIDIVERNGIHWCDIILLSSYFHSWGRYIYI